MTTLVAIEERIKKLQAKAEAMRKKQISAVVAEIRSLMKAHGLSLADLSASGRVSGKTAAAKESSTKDQTATPHKYRDPTTGATWSGRGRAPAWIANAKNRARFQVSALAESGKSGMQKRTGNYLRGPQPAKYRDPKTGAEWSGRGRAPAWLATARDRNKFLISAPHTEAAANKKARAGKTASARKTSRRKQT